MYYDHQYIRQLIKCRKEGCNNISNILLLTPRRTVMLGLHRICCNSLNITWNSHLKCDKMIEYLTNDALQGTGHHSCCVRLNHTSQVVVVIPIYPTSKIEKVQRGVRGEKSSKDMASSKNLVSTIGALASPKMGDGTRCPEG